MAAEDVPSACYIKFEVRGAENLGHLVTMVELLKFDKAAGRKRTSEEWAGLFSSEQISAFWWPDESELAMWEKFWFSTPLPRRHSPEMPQPAWAFESLLDAILVHGDYDLLSVRALNEAEAILEFDPHGYPYGGTAALRALVRAFGHRVIGAGDGTGYMLGDPEPPKWTPDMQVEAEGPKCLGVVA